MRVTEYTQSDEFSLGKDSKSVVLERTLGL